MRVSYKINIWTISVSEREKRFVESSLKPVLYKSEPLMSTRIGSNEQTKIIHNVTISSSGVINNVLKPPTLALC